MATVELKHVGKRYPGATSMAVTDFNLSAKDGEFIVLVGPSGCGKTTTLRMIAGLEDHTEGEIDIGGRDVAGVLPKDRDIAMVFQSYALYPHMSVRGNMALSLKFKKYSKAEINKRVTDAAVTLGIQNLLARKPKALSGGQRQRVALGRAIVRQPQVFLMDEPLSNLDAKLRVGMRAEIIRLQHELSVTAFYVTHDQVEAMTMGHRIVVMNDGVVQQLDTPNKLYENPSNVFVAGFIGTPSMNFLTAEIDDGHANGAGFQLVLDSTRLSAVGPRQTVRVGIRPEHLHLASTEDESCRFSGTVEVVEPLGSVTTIQVRVADRVITAQVEPHQSVAIGDDVTLTCEPARLYLFDNESEATLTGIDTRT